jgi:hypothetical protein
MLAGSTRGGFAGLDQRPFLRAASCGGDSGLSIVLTSLQPSAFVGVSVMFGGAVAGGVPVGGSMLPHGLAERYAVPGRARQFAQAVPDPHDAIRCGTRAPYSGW